MERGINGLQCATCRKETKLSQDFCSNHYQEFFDKLDNEINHWKDDANEKIKQIAEECRQELNQHLTRYINQREINLSKLAEQIEELWVKNDFIATGSFEFQKRLREFTRSLNIPPNISIKQETTSFINKISIVTPLQHLIPSYINSSTTWKKHGSTIAGGNEGGNQLNQLFNPFGIQVGKDGEYIYIADQMNHRIARWKYGANTGEVVAGGNGIGDRMDQLSYPTDVIIDRITDSLIICDQGNKRIVRWYLRDKTNQEIIISDVNGLSITMDKTGDLYVCDCEKNEVRRWKIGEKNGTIVAGGNGEGDKLNQLDFPKFIFVDENYSVYVSDSCNHRVMKWIKGAKEGIIIAGGQGQGKKLSQLDSPNDVIVDDEGNVYVADCGNDRIILWSPESEEGQIIVGGNEEGKKSNQLNVPVGISIDQTGNLYVVDNNNHRIQKFFLNSVCFSVE